MATQAPLQNLTLYGDVYVDENDCIWWDKETPMLSSAGTPVTKKSIEEEAEMYASSVNWLNLKEKNSGE